jgi:hypothetical protein
VYKVVATACEELAAEWGMSENLGLKRDEFYPRLVSCTFGAVQLIYQCIDQGNEWAPDGHARRYLTLMAVHSYVTDPVLAVRLLLALVSKLHKGLSEGAIGYKSDEVESSEMTAADAKSKVGDYTAVAFSNRVWSVNLFTAEEVKAIGRDKLMSAPCEVAEDWSEGALLLMMHKDSFSSTHEERQRLRKYLGVEGGL